MSVEEGKHIYEVDDIVRAINDAPLSGNTIAPPITIGEQYIVKDICIDSRGNQHLDLGFISAYNFITSWETGEELPNKDVHWVNPIRVTFIK